MSVRATEHLATVVTIQPAEVEAQKIEDQPDLSTHPLGSVLLRLELALALISFSRREARPSKAKARINKAR